MLYQYIKMSYDAKRNIARIYEHAKCAIDIEWFKCAQRLQLKKKGEKND